MSRLPLRWRLTLAFGATAAVALVALGAFLHVRLRSELDASLQRGLRQRAADLVVLARRDAAGLGRSGLSEHGDDIAQVLGPAGTVVAGAPGFERRPLITPAQQRRARAGTLTLRRELADDEDSETVALLATRAGSRTVVVGAALEERDQALASLDRILALGVPAALLVAAILGFAVSGRALAPVTRLRRRAETIGAAKLAERLPVPAARDEVRALAETLNAMLARLQEGFERERAFVADASHELRTPLATLRAELELASRPGRRPQELTAAVASAAEETERLVRLAEDLLALARTDRGDVELVAAIFAVDELLDDVALRASATTARTVARGAGSGLHVHADRLRCEQALANLVDNALRHGEGAVTLSAVAVPGAVELHVRDEGPGLPAAFAEHAFERFTRADSSRHAEGAGLGLAIVAGIARMHGGSAGMTPGAPDAWLRLPA